MATTMSAVLAANIPGAPVKIHGGTNVDGTYYSGTSNEGLMYIGGSDAGTVCKNLTQQIFTRDRWEALNPKSCLIGQHGGALHLFFASADGVSHYGYVINLFESGKTAVSTHNEIAACLCEDDVTGNMDYIRKAE